MRLEDLKPNFLEMDPAMQRAFVQNIRKDRRTKKQTRKQKVEKMRAIQKAPELLASLSDAELAALLKEFE